MRKEPYKTLDDAILGLCKFAVKNPDVVKADMSVRVTGELIDVYVNPAIAIIVLDDVSTQDANRVSIDEGQVNIDFLFVDKYHAVREEARKNGLNPLPWDYANDDVPTDKDTP